MRTISAVALVQSYAIGFAAGGDVETSAYDWTPCSDVTEVDVIGCSVWLPLPEYWDHRMGLSRLNSLGKEEMEAAASEKESSGA